MKSKELKTKISHAHSLIFSRALSSLVSKIWSEVPEIVEALLDLAMRCSDGSRERIAKQRPRVKQCITELTEMLQSDDLSQVWVDTRVQRA